MSTKIQQSAERRQQTAKSRLAPLIGELSEELNEATSPEVAAVLKFARRTLSVAQNDLTADTARASAAAMRQVTALWPTSRAYDGAVAYLDSLIRVAA